VTEFTSSDFQIPEGVASLTLGKMSATIKNTEHTKAGFKSKKAYDLLVPLFATWVELG
jgi:hypothetical protein